MAIDCADPHGLARFWCVVLGYQVHDEDDEVRRLLDLGARHTDVGQGDERWVVLADPEGNEFCVLADRRP
ncbi:MAG TPA: VOC family protein [Kineosporiaceae bacterium]|nr:VOC family protein [Kineosporiaceae bacterium]